MIKIRRRKSRAVKIRNIRIGADNPVAIQSMVKVSTADVTACLTQVRELEAAGCEIVRLAIKDAADALAFRQVRKQTKMPLVADIHFDWRLGLACIDAGADKIRLNPGNIYKESQVREVVSAAKSARISLRVGVNSGSLKSPHSVKSPLAKCLAESALSYARKIEKMKFYDIVISLKASSVLDTIAAYRRIAGLCDYPLHLGVTATGLPLEGSIKSSVAIGALLLEGIGDTIRVSLTGLPAQEVRVAQRILEASGLRHFGPEVISCPTCGRCGVDLVDIVSELEGRLRSDKRLKIAVMGCVVNGPGEAREADIGIAFGAKAGLLFKKGKAVKKVSAAKSVDALLKEIGAS